MEYVIVFIALVAFVWYLRKRYQATKNRSNTSGSGGGSKTHVK